MKSPNGDIMRKTSYDLPLFQIITRRFAQVMSQSGHYQETSRCDKLLCRKGERVTFLREKGVEDRESHSNKRSGGLELGVHALAANWLPITESDGQSV